MLETKNFYKISKVDEETINKYKVSTNSNAIIPYKDWKQNSNSKDKFFENCLRHKEARVEMIPLASGYACKQDCTKGVCQFKVASRYEDDQVREK